MAEPPSKHPHNEFKFFLTLVDDAIKNSESDTAGGKSGNERGALSDNQMSDNYETDEEKARSRIITGVLSQYESAYRNKVEFQKWCRKVLFWGCSLIIILFSIGIVVITWGSIHSDEMDLSQVATVIAAVVSFVALIIKLIEIITSYCFPEDDEQYIVNIIQSIQTNDLEKEKEHNRATEAKRKDGK